MKEFQVYLFIAAQLGFARIALAQLFSSIFVPKMIEAEFIPMEA